MSVEGAHSRQIMTLPDQELQGARAKKWSEHRFQQGSAPNCPNRWKDSKTLNFVDLNSLDFFRSIIHHCPSMVCLNVYPSLNAFQATFNLRIFGTVAFPCFTLYPFSPNTLPISM